MPPILLVLLLLVGARAADESLVNDLNAELAGAGVPCAFAATEPPTLACTGLPELMVLGMVHDFCPLLADSGMTALRLDAGSGPRACTTAPACRCEGESDGDVAYWAVEDAMLAEAQQAGPLYGSGRVAEALEHSKRALAILERAGVADTHPMKVPRVYEVAWATGHLGDHTAAAALYDRILWAFADDRVFPPPVRGPMMNNVGLTLHYVGRSSEGLDLIRAALALLPAGQPDRAAAMANLGAILVRRGDYAEAEPLLTEAIPQLTGRPDVLGGALASLGEVHLAFGRTEEAEAAWRRSVEVLAPLRAYPQWPIALLGVARVLTVRGRHTEAIAALEAARTACLDHGDAVMVARIDRLIAERLAPREPDAAEVRFEAAEAALIAVDPAQGELVELWLARGWFDHGREREDEARIWFDRAVELAGSSHPDRLVSALLQAGSFRMGVGEPITALEFARRGLALAEGGDRVGFLALTGYLELEVNGPKAAKPLLEEAAGLAEGLPAADRATVLQFVAALRKLEGDLDAAAALIEEAVALREASLGPDHDLTFLALTDLGAVYGEQGRHERAVEVLEAALAGHERIFGPEAPQLVKSLQNLGVAYGELGETDRAIAVLQRALGIAEARSSVQLAAAVRANLGAMHIARGEAAAAIALYEASLVELRAEVGESHRAYVDTLVRLSRAEMLAGRDDAALRHLQQAGDLIREGVDVAPRDVVSALYSAGLLCERLADAACAEQAFAMAVEGGRKVGAEHPDVLFAQAHLAYVLLRAGRGDDARPHVEHVLQAQERQLAHVLAVGDDAQRRGFVRVLQSQLDLLVSVHMDGGPAAEIVGPQVVGAVLARKGIVLDAEIDRISLRERHASPEQEALIQALRSDTRRLANLVLRGAEADAAFHGEQVAALEARIAGIEAQLGGETAFPKVDLAVVASSVPADAVLVEILRYQRVTWPHTPARPHYAGYVVRPDGTFVVVDLGPADPIDEAATDLVDALRTCTGGCRGVRAVAGAPVADLPARSRALHDLVFAPLVPALGDTRRVLLAADGALALVPFDALIDGTGEPLIRSWSFAYLGAGRDLLRAAGAGEPGPALVIAAPDYGGSASLLPAAEVLADSRAGDVAAMAWPPLPGTALEARHVGRLVAKPRVTLVGTEATEAALKAARSPRVLHVATHGFFLPDDGRGDDPMLRSGLALVGANGLAGDGSEDGVLTARELAMEVDLRLTELVVLSACETGVGEVHGGQGVYGLRRALVLAGAEAQVMSLWQVDDLGTQELMVRFYKHLRRGRAPAEALRAAQLELLDSGTWAHPYYWAAFVASG